MSSADRIDFEMEVEVESASSGPAVDPPNPTSPAPPVVTGKSVVVTTATTGSVTVSLHPLVIMNVSEHWTRLRAQEGSPQTVVGAVIGKQKGRNIEVMNSFELVFSVIEGDIIIDRDSRHLFSIIIISGNVFNFPVVGAVIGKQKGRNIEVMNSFELVFSVIEGDIIIDRDYYNLKEEQFKQVFSDMDFLGWYTTGEAPTEREIAVHRQICDINECPVMMMLNPANANNDQLPVVLYESVIDVVNGHATMLLAPLTYTLAAEEAERIGVDHVARVSSGEAAFNSLVAEHLTAQRSAIKMLVSRVRAVLATVRAIRDGRLPPRPALLREARALANRLPLLTSQQFRTHFYNQCNDVALMTYLGTITKGCNGINQLVNRFNVLYDRQGMGRRMRGLFF